VPALPVAAVSRQPGYQGWSHPERLDLQCVTVDSLYERAGQPFE